MRRRVPCFRTIGVAAVASAAIGASARPAAAATLEVPGTYPTVGAAFAVATAGDTVAIACGTYPERLLQIPSGIVVRGDPDDPSCVTLDGGGGGTVLYGWFLSAETRIEGLTVTGGDASGHGGGFYFVSSDVRISRCVFADNRTENWGGGIAFQGTSSPRIEDCEFRGNRSLYGGGIYCEAGTVEVRRCTFRDNAARLSGGGLAAWGGASRVLVEDCVFVRNQGTFVHGGAILASGADVSLVGCTLARNVAQDHGSAVFARQNARVRLKRCIVAFHPGAEALACGGTGTIEVSCSDVHKNVGGDWTECVAGEQEGRENFSADPLFCDPDAFDYTLRSDSPCLPSGPHACGLVGALGPGCGAIRVEPLGWGKAKALYR